jgi:hypothetical protein
MQSLERICVLTVCNPQQSGVAASLRTLTDAAANAGSPTKRCAPAALDHPTGTFGSRGRVDILVNCAAAVGGQGKPPTLVEITNEPFFADMNIKVLGVSA